MTSKELLERGLRLHGAGDIRGAELLYRQLLEHDPANSLALHLMGMIRLQQGQLREAQAFLEAALQIQPSAPDTLVNYGVALSGLGRDTQALAALNQAVAVMPDGKTYLNRGAVLSKLGRPEEAVADFDRAVALDGRNVHALHNRALTLHGMGRLDEALSDFDHLLAMSPGSPEVRYNRGHVLRTMGRRAEALKEFDLVLQGQPFHAGALKNRAGVLWSMDRLDESLECYDRVLAVYPDDVEALENRSNLLWARRQALPLAIADLERLILIAPNRPYAFGDLMHLKMHAGNWQDFASNKALLDEAVRAGMPAVSPFAYQALSDSPADLLACAETYTKLKHAALPSIARNRARKAGRICIGYVSGEFRAQATMYLAAGLFEQHDRSRFEIFAFDNGRDDESLMRKRVIAAFDEFISIAALSDIDAAHVVAKRDIDILVNLNGYFGKPRMNLFAQRYAPVQVNYLGFPGTLGADYMDYILADATVIPSDEHRFYLEKVVTLPNSYQVNDSKREPAGQALRATHNLPDNAFVFCHFNSGYKITPTIFAIWMRILQTVPEGVLWLLGGDPLFVHNIKAEAARSGINPARLIFAPILEWQPHLARLTLADLFLDSLPYNAHTTASDALWAGLPLLTCRGHSFQGRVAASLLRTVGLPELVTEDLATYEGLAIRLAQDAKLLKTYRDRLAQNRQSTPLFNTVHITRHIEWAYEAMHLKRQSGRDPESFVVPLQTNNHK